MSRWLPAVAIATLVIIVLFFPVAPIVCSITPGAPAVGAGGPALLSFEELIALYEQEIPSAPLAAKLETLLATPFVDNTIAPVEPNALRASSPQIGPVLRVAQRNIERGLAFDDIRAALGGRDSFAKRLNQQPNEFDPKERARALDEAHMLGGADVIVLNEVDWGLKRTGYRHVAMELAAALGMNYAFAVEFVEVDPLTLGNEKLERDQLEDRDQLLTNLAVDRERTIGLHGSVILSRYPLKNVRIMRFRTEGHDWYDGEKKSVAALEKGKRKASEVAFLEKVLREIRRGGRMMMLAEIEDPKIPGGRATIINAHLEAKTKPSNRRRQLEEILDAIKSIDHPVILAGDFNTSGSNATPTSIKREVKKRLGDSAFWAQNGIKWATGFGLLYDATRGAFNFGRAYSDPTVRSIKFVLENDEAKFFETLEEFRFADGGAFDFRGSDLRSSDGHGGKLANSNERANKGFKPTFEPERSFKVARLKLDWFFVKPPGLKKPDDDQAPYIFAPHFGRTLQALNYCLGERLSDHNPMIVDLPITAPPVQSKGR